MSRNAWLCAMGCVLLSAIPTWAFADPRETFLLRERQQLVWSKANLGDQAELVLENGQHHAGKINDLQGRFLELETYDYDKDRFLASHFSLVEIDQLTVRRESRNWIYPLLGSLVLGALGVATGADAAEPPEYREYRAGLMLAFGAAGAATGALLGTTIAPRKQVRMVLWTFD